MRQTPGSCRLVVLGEGLLIPPGFPAAAGLPVLHSLFESPATPPKSRKHFCARLLNPPRPPAHLLPSLGVISERIQCIFLEIPEVAEEIQFTHQLPDQLRPALAGSGTPLG